jgi:hypothetical protein
MGTRRDPSNVVIVLLSAAAITGLAVSCGAQPAPAGTASAAVSATAAQSTVATTAVSGTFTNPFTYCAAVNTMDTPDARYNGPQVPDAVVSGLQKAMELPTGTPPPPLLQGSHWRCMDGKVYACTVGANLPCEDKANTDRDPTQEMNDYCAANQNSDVVPAAVTGHNTVYEWHCQGATAEVVRQIMTPDARGYLANIWYEISPGQ